MVDTLDGWRDEGALDSFIAQAQDEYHSTLDPDMDPMDEWLLMQDLVRVTVAELEGDRDLQLEQSIMHEMWNIIYPDVHWVHVTYDTNAFGWGKHHIMPFMLYDDWLVNQDRINLETGRVEDGDLMTVIGSYSRVKQEIKTRAAHNKKLRSKFDDWR
jgi:hypothetical protein